MTPVPTDDPTEQPARTVRSVRIDAAEPFGMQYKVVVDGHDISSQVADVVVELRPNRPALVHLTSYAPTGLQYEGPALVDLADPAALDTAQVGGLVHEWLGGIDGDALMKLALQRSHGLGESPAKAMLDELRRLALETA